MNIHPVTSPGAASTVTFATAGLSGTTTSATHIIISNKIVINK
jgi:hypothetical protein